MQSTYARAIVAGMGVDAIGVQQCVDEQPEHASPRGFQGLTRRDVDELSKERAIAESGWGRDGTEQ
jgi:hypothetical protein